MTTLNIRNMYRTQKLSSASRRVLVMLCELLLMGLVGGGGVELPPQPGRHGGHGALGGEGLGLRRQPPVPHQHQVTPCRTRGNREPPQATVTVSFCYIGSGGWAPSHC